MKPKSHVFITKKFLDKCLEVGRFGVSAQQINHLANVDRGDQAFLLETKSGRLVGPLTIEKPLYKGQKDIWNDGRSETDPFKYRVKFERGPVRESGLRPIWEVLLARKAAYAYGFSTFQRSNNSLLPEEGEQISSYLKSKGIPLEAKLQFGDVPGPIDYFGKDRKRFSSEARLEAALLSDKPGLIEMLRAEGLLNSAHEPHIINQLPLPGTNYSLDIAVLAGKDTIVLELKKDEATPEASKQVDKYAEFWSAAKVTARVVCICAGNSADRDGLHERWGYSIDYDRASILICGPRGTHNLRVRG